jgi:hypothetical protein
MSLQEFEPCAGPRDSSIRVKRANVFSRISLQGSAPLFNKISPIFLKMEDWGLQVLVFKEYKIFHICPRNCGGINILSDHDPTCSNGHEPPLVFIFSPVGLSGT